MPMSQRDIMRQIYRRNRGRSDDAIIKEYARAEVRGDVQRVNNTYNLSPEDYARRLLADGRIKGWL
jgi:hypothetical protein